MKGKTVADTVLAKSFMLFANVNLVIRCQVAQHCNSQNPDNVTNETVSTMVPTIITRSLAEDRYS